MGPIALTLTGIGITFSFYLVQKYFGFLSETLFELESQGIMKFLFFRSFDWFRYSLPSFFILVNLYIMYNLLTHSSDWLSVTFSILLLCSTCWVSYKLFVVISADKNFYHFQESTSSVRYYNRREEAKRREIHFVFMRRLGDLSLAHLGECRFVDFLKKNYVPKLASVISFERFDYWLENSESQSYTGTLFYSKFKKCIDKELVEIRSRYNADDLNDSDLQLVVSVLLDPSALNFDDKKGLHYNSEQLRIDIDGALDLSPEDGLLKGISEKLIEIEEHIQKIKDGSNTKLELSDFELHMINSIEKVNVREDVANLAEKLVVVSEDLRFIKSNAVCRENLVEVNQSIIEAITEFTTSDTLIERMIAIESGIKNIGDNKALEELEVKLNDLVDAVYTLSPKIVHMLPEALVLDNIIEFLIKDLRDT